MTHALVFLYTTLCSSHAIDTHARFVTPPLGAAVALDPRFMLTTIVLTYYT